MVFVKWNKEKVEVTKDKIKRIKNLSLLEKRLKKLGWTNLRWCPGGDDNRVRRELYGCPPNYDGPMEGYEECAIKTLAVPGDPIQDSEKILVRDVLHRAIDYEKDCDIKNYLVL